MSIICVRSLRNVEVEAAFKFCVKAHDGQYRRYTHEPYWVHPLEVANLTWWQTRDTTLTVAALLHDVIEDTNFSKDDICQHFGSKAANIVEELSVDPTLKHRMSRSERKTIAMQQVLDASQDAQLIKRADMISNCRGVWQQNPEFAAVYLAEKQKLLEQLPNDGSMIDHLVRHVVKLEMTHLYGFQGPRE